MEPVKIWGGSAVVLSVGQDTMNEKEKNERGPEFNPWGTPQERKRTKGGGGIPRAQIDDGYVDRICVIAAVWLGSPMLKQ